MLGSLGPPERRNVDIPKNVRQVYGAKVKQDDLFNLYQLGYEISDFIQVNDCAKGMKVLLCLQGAANHVRQLYKVYNVIEYNYDTTYAAG